MVNKLGAFLIAGLVPLAASASYVDDIAIINAQIQLVNKNAELQAALQKSQGASITLPKILTLISDMNGSEATVVYTSGRTRTIKSGDKLTSTVKVKSISAAGVEVTTSKGSTYLAFNNPEVTDQALSDLSVMPTAPSISMPSIPVPSGSGVPAPPVPNPTKG